ARNEDHGSGAGRPDRADAVSAAIFPRARIRPHLGDGRGALDARIHLSFRAARGRRAGAGRAHPRSCRNAGTNGRNRARARRVSLVRGAPVPMVLDSGASAVAPSREAAKAAGLPLEVLNYSVNVETANGRARAAPVTLDRLSIGGISERSVPALIAQPGQLRTSLLG